MTPSIGRNTKSPVAPSVSHRGPTGTDSLARTKYRE
jgi:hypothetical protein